MVGLVIGVCVPSATNAADLWRRDGDALRLTGSYKNLLIRSETVQGAESYTLDLNRLRVELQGTLGERAALDVQYDHEAFLGSALRTDEFSTRTRRDPETYLDLEDAYVDRADVFARHRLHRGYLTISSPRVDVTVGRQRIGWGTARFWNPTDLLNPFNPLHVEREERTGVDAALVQAHLGALSTLSVVYAPQQPERESSLAARLRTNRAGFDVSAMGGRFGKDAVIGVDVAGAIGDVGVRGEATYTAAATTRDVIRAVAGADYTFPSTWSLMAELYQNGRGAAHEADYDVSGLLAGEVVSLARWYLAVGVGYDVTPLLRADTYVIGNLSDGSVFVNPVVTYAMVTDFEWTLGVQRFRGSADSEYGLFAGVLYTQVQWFF